MMHVVADGWQNALEEWRGERRMTLQKVERKTRHANHGLKVKSVDQLITVVMNVFSFISQREGGRPDQPQRPPHRRQCIISNTVSYLSSAGGGDRIYRYQ